MRCDIVSSIRTLHIQATNDVTPFYTLEEDGHRIAFFNSAEIIHNSGLRKIPRQSFAIWYNKETPLVRLEHIVNRDGGLQYAIFDGDTCIGRLNGPGQRRNKDAPKRVRIYAEERGHSHDGMIEIYLQDGCYILTTGGDATETLAVIHHDGDDWSVDMYTNDDRRSKLIITYALMMQNNRSYQLA